ncbi:carbohydrate kinase [Brevibacterium aurantiacum]|uniref:Fructokinase n=1 Tax=Brevibacterium aurantiacum TaxID=273384 RepID=A0A2H1J039_BREAU|nr:carbohydrate kinase [Brevibacterium aurantiacum]AZL12726.1 carbohydrate kinase [Brevibacterium aurantiacum]SMX80731.1 fructokinase [Brevibacterium aurantiacum]
MSILVIGEALIDIVSSAGSPDRYAPGGAPANVALGLGRLGADAELLTDVGDDFHGGFLLAHLRESHVRVHARPTGSTSTARALLSTDGSAEYEFSLRWDPDASLVDSGEWTAIHVGSIAAFLSPGAAAVDSLLQRGGDSSALLSFDPNIRPSIIGDRQLALARFESLATRVDVVKLSDVDADWLYPGQSADAQIDRILRLGAKLVALTCGSQDSILSTASSRVRVPAGAVKVRDTIGAGDTFMASLVHDLQGAGSHFENVDEVVLADLGENASRRAAITVSRAGADLPWAGEEGA